MHSSSSSSLTIQDLNRLLFEMEPTSAIEYTENNSAAAMSLGESSSVVQEKGLEPNSLLASIIGDLVPAAEAVIGDNSLFNNSSLMNNHSTPYMDTTPYMDPSATPYMDTPYLDPTTPFMDPTTMGTPYTPFTPTFTPSVNGTPHFSPYIESCKDIPMANYLVHDDISNLMENACSSTTATLNRGSQSAIEQTLASFNGDPAQLLLDKGKSTMTSNSTTTTMHANSAPLTWHDEPAAESSDMLFPPLPGDSQPTSSDMDFDFGNDEDQNNGTFMDELLGFDFSGSVITSSNNVEQSGSNNNNDNKSNNNSQSSNEESKENDNTASSNVHSESAVASSSTAPVTTATNKRKRGTASSSENKTQTKRRRNAKVSNNNDNAIVNEKRYQCDICKIKFSRRYNLGTHIKTHDKNRQKEFLCDVCPKGFDRKHDRDRHIATVHHGERSYACDRCDASFSRKDALSRHLDHKHGVV